MKEKLNKMGCVVSEKIYTPQTFVEIMTDKAYYFEEENTVAEIEQLLEQNGISNLWNYPLSEIDEIVENNHKVVLVDCSGFYGTMEIQPLYRWFEVGENAYKFIEGGNEL